MSEYYIDRITTGLPATVNYQGKKYPLRITKVVPEVKDRMFDVDLVFTGEMPDNVRVGKSFRVQIELGQPEQAIVIPRGNFYQPPADSGFTKPMHLEPKPYVRLSPSDARIHNNMKLPED